RVPPGDLVAYSLNPGRAEAGQPTWTGWPTSGVKPPSRLAICTTSRSLGDSRTWMSIRAPRYDTNSTVPDRLLSSPDRGSSPISTRSGLSDSTAWPGLPPAQARARPPLLRKRPGASTVPARKVVRPTEPPTEGLGGGHEQA